MLATKLLDASHKRTMLLPCTIPEIRSLECVWIGCKSRILVHLDTACAEQSFCVCVSVSVSVSFTEQLDMSHVVAIQKLL